MKRLNTVLLLVLLIWNAWLTLRQRHMELNVETLRTENSRLAVELAQKPSISPEEFRDASARMERAGAFVEAAEARLTNASALLGQLQSASRSLANSPRTSARTPPARYLEPVSTVVVADASLGPPASSHDSTGQLFRRSWGPEQVLGPPDTHQAGDIPTAWAPRSSQGGANEWLQVHYDQAVDIAEIRVRETYNPGAIAKLAAILPDGREVVIWEGVTVPTQPPSDTTFSVPSGLQAQQVKIYLDRTRAPGWNEIDAVEMVARDGTRQWASSAKASTSFASQSHP